MHFIRTTVKTGQLLMRNNGGNVFADLFPACFVKFPSLEPLELTHENGYSTVTLPRIVGYQMILLIK